MGMWEVSFCWTSWVCFLMSRKEVVLPLPLWVEEVELEVSEGSGRG